VSLPARVRRGAVACALACAVAAAGCSAEDEGSSRERADSDGAKRSSAESRRDAPRADARTREPARKPGAAASAVPQVSCPAAAHNCRSASGRVLYVERVDPDGDGDAHFVLASRQSITAPGISVIDVKRSLRPSPLPRPGDRLSAAGPVYRGSYGQKQIEAVELHVAR
jgi:hypothetical protein